MSEQAISPEATSSAGEVDWDDIPSVEPSQMGEGTEDIGQVSEPAKLEEVKENYESQEKNDVFDELDEKNEEIEENQEDSSEKEIEESEEEISEEDSEELENKLNIEEIKDKLVSVKIDGEDQEVPIQELINNYSGKIAYDKKFTQLDQARQKFESEVKDIEGYINDFAGKMKSNDVLGAFEYFGQFANIPPFMIKEQLLNALQPEMARRAELSPEQLQNEMLYAQNNYLKQLNESESRKREIEQANLELESATNSLRETYSISDSEWKEASKALEQHKDQLGEVTPEVRAEYVLNVRAYDKAESVMASNELQVSGNEQFLDTLAKIALENPDFTDEDLSQIVQESVKVSQKQTIAKKLESKIEKAKPKKTAAPKQEVQIEEGPEDWDDIL